MKKMSKILCLVLVIAMVFAFSTTAFAANDGSITVKNATNGLTYSAVKVFDLTFEGENVAYSYTATGANDPFLLALNGSTSPFEVSESTTTDVYNVNLKSGATDAEILAFLNGYFSDETETDGVVTGRTLKDGVSAQTTVAANSTASFSNLPYGYYYILSPLGADVTIDSTLKDVTVIDKNEGPGWNGPGKFIIDENDQVIFNSVNYGDEVNFGISVKATSYVKDERADYYYIKDTLGEGFSPATDIAVTITKADDTENPVTLAAGTGYTLAQNGNTFQITIPFGETYGSNAVIDVTYKATVLNTEAVVLAGDGNKNKANYTWSTGDTPGDNPPYDEENEKETTTYVFAIGILKVDPQGKPLTGAVFSVTDANGASIKASGSNGVYIYDPDNGTTDFAVSDDGILIIKGLKEGTYTLKEEVAPLGYNQLTETYNITAAVSEVSTYTTTITTYYDAEGNVVDETESTTSKTTDVPVNVIPFTVVNRPGEELPETGGIGTTIFYVFGSIFLLGAGVTLITRRRVKFHS